MDHEATVLEKPDFEVDDIPQDFVDSFVEADPELQEIVAKEKKSAPAKRGKVATEKPAVEKNEDVVTESTETDDNAELPDTTEGLEEKPVLVKEEKPEAVDYKDDVIPGLKGKDFAEIPDPVKEILDKFVEEHETVKGKAKSAEERLAKLMADPVVKDRAILIETNQNLADYDIEKMNISDDESLKIKAAFGLNDEQIGRLKPLITAVAHQMADAQLKNRLKIHEQQATIKENTAKGWETLRSLGKMDKNLAINETDLSKIVDEKGMVRDNHPEREIYLKLAEACRSLGWDWTRLAQTEPEVLYAAIAAKMKLPVALNTTERDKKIIAETKKNTLKHFQTPKGEARTLSSEPDPERGTERVIVRDGFDIKRLASDPDYYETIVSKKWGDLEWQKKVDDLADRGRNLLKEQSNKKKTR